MRGAVKESAVLPAFFQITLGFEDLHHGHDRGVSDFAALKEDFIDITDGRSAAWQWPCRSASRCWTSFLRLTVGVAFLWKSCAFLLVKKQPCNRKGGRLPFAARGNSW